MSEEYSIYDAKAKLSALVRQVREGASFVITVHGEPVAELRPFENPEAPLRTQSIEERMAELEARGEFTHATMNPGDARAFPIGKPKPGALKRFLDDRE